MESARSYGMTMNYQTTRPHIPEDGTLPSHHSFLFLNVFFLNDEIYKHPQLKNYIGLLLILLLLLLLLLWPQCRFWCLPMSIYCHLSRPNMEPSFHWALGEFLSYSSRLLPTKLGQAVILVTGILKVPVSVGAPALLSQVFMIFLAPSSRISG
jgi:hypothetical protein